MIDKTKEGALGFISYLNRKKAVFHLKKRESVHSSNTQFAPKLNIPTWSDRVEQILTLILDE